MTLSSGQIRKESKMRPLTRYITRKYISTKTCPYRGFLPRHCSPSPSPRVPPLHEQRRENRHAAALGGSKSKSKSSAGFDGKIPTVSRIVNENAGGEEEVDREGGGYTAAYALFEGLWEAGVRNCFVKVGSDHPSFLEAFVKGKRERPGEVFEARKLYGMLLML